MEILQDPFLQLIGGIFTHHICKYYNSAFICLESWFTTKYITEYILGPDLDIDWV
jgi:hypothetical protein